MPPATLRHPRARSYTVLRTAHLERARDFRPASILYGRRRYDFDPSLAEGLDLHPTSPPAVLAALLRNPRVTAVEVNEPLQLDALPRSLAVVAAARLRKLRGRPLQVVSYAIENRDPFDRAARAQLVRGAGAVTAAKRRVKLAGQLAGARLLAASLDRLAFGTPGAESLYRRRLGPALRGVAQRTLPALPAPCTCPHRDRDADRVLFVGALHSRKGITQLLAAWPGVLAARPSARLLVLGAGDLLPEVRDVAAQPAVAGSVEVVVDPPRAEIHAAQRSASVAVLLSQRSPRWREQVGLPVVEGLAHGCAVVASTETGLADWLAGHGHRVLDPDCGPELLAQAVVAALTEGRSAGDVLGDLPAVDGRRTADEWLLPDEPAEHRADA